MTTQNLLRLPVNRKDRNLKLLFVIFQPKLFFVEEPTMTQKEMRSTLLNLGDEAGKVKLLVKAAERLLDDGFESESKEITEHGIHVIWLGVLPAFDRLDARFKEAIAQN